MSHHFFLFLWLAGNGLILAAQSEPLVPDAAQADPVKPVPGDRIPARGIGRAAPDAGKMAPRIAWHVGPKFQSEINRPVSGTWSNVELRDILNRLSVERRVSVVMDRRVDPTAKLPLEINSPSLRVGVEDIARQVEARLSVPESVLFVGPVSAVSRLRTLIALREAELNEADLGASEKRRFELFDHHAVRWDDLDSPQEILKRIADRWQLVLHGESLVPHDLWAGGTIPHSSAAEALSIILIQFDLTFRWVDKGRGIEIVRAPNDVAISRRHRTRSHSISDAQKLITRRFPNLVISDVPSERSSSPAGTTSGTSKSAVVKPAETRVADLMVQATVEEHEAIDVLLSPASSKKPAVITGPAPLRQRQFTLRLERVPATALMRKLEESDVAFEYDAELLTAAGIDLDQLITVKVDKVSAEDFFKAIFDPLGVAFEIDNLTVRLSPKRASK